MTDKTTKSSALLWDRKAALQSLPYPTVELLPDGSIDMSAILDAIESALPPAGPGWTALDEAEPPKHKLVLVTNRIGETDAHGEPSHVWLTKFVRRGSDGDWMTFAYNMQVRYLTHWRLALPPAGPALTREEKAKALAFFDDYDMDCAAEVAQVGMAVPSWWRKLRAYLAGEGE